MWYLLTQNGYQEGTYLSYDFACDQYVKLTKQYPYDHIKLLFEAFTKTNMIFDSKEIDKTIGERK